MNAIIKTILLFILSFFFISNFGTTYSSYNTKDLIISKSNLKKIIGGEKYIKLIDTIINKYKSNEKVLLKLKNKIDLASTKYSSNNSIKGIKRKYIFYYMSSKINLELEKYSIVDDKKDGFFVKTKVINTYNINLFNSNIVYNSVEISDNRSMLNSFKYVTTYNVDSLKIKIIPCDNIPLEIEKKESILGECIEIINGVKHESGSEGYLIFPKNIFKESLKK